MGLHCVSYNLQTSSCTAELGFTALLNIHFRHIRIKSNTFRQPASAPQWFSQQRSYDYLTIQMMFCLKQLVSLKQEIPCPVNRKVPFYFPSKYHIYIQFLQKCLTKSWTGNRKLIGVKPKPRHYGISTKMFYYILLYLRISTEQLY